MSIWLANLLSEFAMFEKEYSFKSLLFTRSASCITFARSLQIDVVEQFPEDRRGNPFLFNMLAVAKRRYSAHFYGYMDYKTLLNPKMFDVLKSVRSVKSDAFTQNSYEIATKSYVLPINDVSPNMHSRESCSEVFSFESEKTVPAPFSVGISVEFED